TCSFDASRLCVTDDHCYLPAIDAESKGPCLGVLPAQPKDAVVHDVVVADNVMTGPFPVFNLAGDAIQAFGTQRTTISANTFAGAGRAGVFVNTESRSKLTVTRNKIKDNGFGFFIALQGTRLPWDANVSLNDFVNNTVGVRAYNLPSELSFVGM